VQHSTKCIESKGAVLINCIQWNLDFTFVKGPFKMNVKSKKWKCM
jgi:hypothetical protein